jgi:hypothetical protein
LINIDPVGGDQLSASARYDAINLGQTHDRNQADEKASERKYGDSRPAWLRGLGNGIHFRLKLPNDANR